MAKTRKIKLVLDELDYETVMEELASRKDRPLPETDDTDGSNLEGLMVAEIIRDLNEYRDLHSRG